MKNMLENRSCLTLTDIENYAADHLEAAARFEVEDHLLDCALCRAALESYVEAPDATAGADVALLQQQIQHYKNPKITIMQKSNFNYAAAAIAALVLTAAAAAYWQHTRYDRLYAQFFTAPQSDNYLALRGEGDIETAPVNAEYAMAMQFYEQGDYAAGLPHFERYLEQSPEDAQATLYAGIASLNGGYPEKAADWLLTASINDPKLFDEANWYLALALLKQQNPASAKDILENLAQNAEPTYAQQAKALLDKVQ